MSGVEKLKQIGDIHKYAANQIICQQGQPGTEMYIILAGRVGIFLEKADKEKTKISEIGAGEFFGEMAIFESQLRSATVKALAETTTLIIDRDNFWVYITQQPEMAQNIMRGMSSRIRSLNSELVALREKYRIKESVSSLEILSGDSSKSVAGDALKDILFPEGHKSYDMTAPDTHGEYLFDKEATCPVCGKTFKYKAVRSSKLKMDRTDYDFRRHYKEFEPLWYGILVCPHCLFASFVNEFDKVPYKSIPAIKEACAKIKAAADIRFSYPQTIDQVFIAYYLTLFVAKITKQGAPELARIWMQLSWLYQDVEDREMYDYTSDLALENYHNAFYNSQLNITGEQEQQYSLILGELNLLKGNFTEAQKNFYAAIKRNSGTTLLTNQARDRLQEVKDRIAAAGKEE